MSELLSPVGPKPARAGGPAGELARRIREKGPITFAEFMEVALYWPEGGYYTSLRRPWGEKGDYITSIDVSPVFAKVLAGQIIEMWDLMGRPEDFTLIEAGAGRGWLSRGILDALKAVCPGLYNVIRACLIERNPNPKDNLGEKIAWFEDLEGIKAPITGVILSNELIDSLPVHRVCSRAAALKELYTVFEGSAFYEVEGEPSTPEFADYFRDSGAELPEGAVAEVNLNAGRWLKKASSVLNRGFLVTIDYGLPAKDLYSSERKSGSLHCHYRHTLNDNPYINIGTQDITAQVDFSALKREGDKCGLEFTGFTTQKNFLLGLGILEELSQADDMDLGNLDKIMFNRALSRLITPGGMGDTFKVLIQHKGLNAPALSGFSFKDMSRYL